MSDREPGSGAMQLASPARAERPLLLALDSSTTTASVALYDGTRVVAESTWESGRQHSAQLLAEVDRAFARVGLHVRQLTGVAVAKGPGSFTGLRVGLSVAKGLAAGLDVPAWGVGTLDVLGYSFRQAAGLVWVVLAAGRGRSALAVYHRGACVEPGRNVRTTELVRLVRPPALVVGELEPEERERLAALPGVEVASPAASARRAGYLAELAWLAGQAGDPGDPVALDAVYLGR